MTAYKSTDKTFGEIVAEDLNADEEFRGEWLRLTVARQFAAMLIGYRSDHDLSQTALGERLALSQPRVAQLESGEKNPDMDTIINVVQKLGTEFAIDVAPAERTSWVFTKRARTAGTVVTHGNVSVTATSA